MTITRLLKELSDRVDVELGAGALQSTIDHAETTLDVVFPRELRDLLLRSGTLDLGHHEFFGLASGTPTYRDLIRMTQSERTDVGRPIPHTLIPLLNDSAGNLICVETAPSERIGTVVFWDHAAPLDEPPEPYHSSIAEWLMSLVADLDQ